MSTNAVVMSEREIRLSDKRKLLEDMLKFFHTGEKMHFAGQVYVNMKDIEWVINAALQEIK